MLEGFKQFVMSGAAGVVAESMHVVGDGIIPEVPVLVAPLDPATSAVAHLQCYSSCTFL